MRCSLMVYIRYLVQDLLRDMWDSHSSPGVIEAFRDVNQKHGVTSHRTSILSIYFVSQYVYTSTE